MREHLLSAIERGKIKAFPTQGKRRPAKPTIQKNPVYCVCWLTDDGSQMIECKDCGEWFHTACVRIEEKYIENPELQWTFSGLVRNAVMFSL